MPSWPDSKKTPENTPQGIVTRAPGNVYCGRCVSTGGPSVGVWGLGVAEVGMGWGGLYPGCSPLVWSGWCSREPGGWPGGARPSLRLWRWAVPRDCWPRLSQYPLLRPGSPAQFSSAWLPSSWFSYLGCRLAAQHGSQAGHFPPSFLTRAFSCLSRPFLPRSSKQTKQASRSRPMEPGPGPQHVCSCGGGELCGGPACGGGRPAAGAPPALPLHSHPFRALPPEAPLSSPPI